MIGLALLGVALVVLIKSAGNSIFNARQAQMMGVATDLSRGKMYEIEEILLKDGFTDTDQSEGDIGEPEAGSAKRGTADSTKRSGKCFEEEGWPNVCYAYRVEQVELPSFEELQQMAQGRAAGSGSARGSATGSGSDGFVEEGGFENSALGGMLGQLGGGFGGGGGDGGGDIDSSMGAAFIQGQYAMVQQTLKASIRKVTLVVWWDVMGRERDLKTVAFFTDPASMDKVLSGLGSQELPDDSAGSAAPASPGGRGGRGSAGTGGPGVPKR
ncbi:MAG: hypothetical protein M3619_04005 [Myxococcota bacterium]|nr:hypothetical protein [Myxococcota bacterium]